MRGNDGVQNTLALRANGKLVTDTLEILGCCALELEVVAIDKCSND